MVQVNNTKITLRFKFRKTGRLKYISHLDLVRTMHKVIVRSDLPLWYTEGFNPKPKMAFAAPLSIGTDSYCEFLDLRLSEMMDPAEAMARINKNLTDDMQIVEAYYPETKFTDLKWFSYTVLIKTSGASKALAQECERALSAERIEILKKTKSGEAIVDIKPMIRSASVVIDSDALRMNAVLSADPSAFLNPEHVVTVLKRECGILSSGDLLSEYYSIVRENAYDAEMNPFR